jgi:hypothetical protein
MFPFPELPQVSETQRATGTMSLRYEDVAQDGRVLASSLPHAVGEVVWRELLMRDPVVLAVLRRGVIPVLSRIVIEGTGGPIAVRHALEGSGAFALAHTVDANGEVDRILLNCNVDVFGEKGRTYGPPPEGAGARIHLGRVFAEHVLTRLFAASKDERKVRTLDVPGAPAVPPDRYAWRAPEELLVLPEGAVPLDATLVPDAAPIVFGLGHTDSNQHVNSLVYPTLFEEAALRRIDAYGRSTDVLARFVELAYRKPCFAGDRMRAMVRAFVVGERVGIVGALVPEGAPEGARPHCCVRMMLE